ncbi:hypothetical protein P872_00735 [Rhodonellum psychrophilum GCM71 = DSM 17998]|uniref:Uncharacterized protein n=1 Tax=Rhodonellum psychrophilum GCM71 = DSM 17998 TaxID=1123057 RepID=U5C780_9BACT|nr:hypothetical protein P872_00735 [Rhodonellum psychrophilum GCM71 = DSM 17998]
MQQTIFVAFPSRKRVGITMGFWDGRYFDFEKTRVKPGLFWREKSIFR